MKFSLVAFIAVVGFINFETNDSGSFSCVEPQSTVVAVIVLSSSLVVAQQVRHPGFITTFAGNGQSGHAGDNGPATAASFGWVTSVVATKNGTVYITDSVAHTVRRVNTTGIITTVAGIPHQSGFSGDGGPSTGAKLNYPIGLHYDESNGSLYIVDSENHRIRVVDSHSGIISTVAGNGIKKFSGDGGLATEASLSSPHGIVGNDKGELFIADMGNNRIRKIGVDKKISTIAGDGSFGDYTEGEEATKSPLVEPVSITFNDAGELLVASKNTAGAYLVLKIGLDGRLRRFAGNGVSSSSGDGGPAVDASFQADIRIALGKNGEVYIADTFGYRVRMVDSEGIISTIAGNGQYGHAGDGGPALEASLSSPFGLSVAPNGDLYVSDDTRVRLIYSFISCFGLNVEDPKVCSGHGKCSKTDVCTCDEDYTGKNCSNRIFTCYNISSINETVCSGHGVCHSTNNCTCDDGYSGKNCSEVIVKCYGIEANDIVVCSGHGTCTSHDNCTCNEEYAGKNCSELIVKCYGIQSTDPSVCSGHGVCGSADNCTCDAKYTGKNCSDLVVRCFGVLSSDQTACSGHGKCSSLDVCICNEGYTGKNCSEQIVKCFGLQSSDTTVCSGHGTCSSEDKCTCHEGYTGEKCSNPIVKCYGIKSTDSTVCSGHGKCTSADKCTCHTGYTGERCSDKAIPNSAPKLEGNKVPRVIFLIVTLMLTSLFSSLP